MSNKERMTIDLFWILYGCCSCFLILLRRVFGVLSRMMRGEWPMTEKVLEKLPEGGAGADVEDAYRGRA